MKKSFKDLTKQMNALEELQQGQLKGGFASFSKMAAQRGPQREVSVSVTVQSGSTCGCGCSSAR